MDIPLSTRDKEKILYRIDELRIKLRFLNGTMLFFLAIFFPILVLLAAYYKQVTFFGMGLFFLVLIVFYVSIIALRTKESKISALLKKNYNVLLGRKIKK
jgi:threonine/homoserine/homoserine lactone efflux protein